MNRDLHLPVYNIKAVSRLVGLLPVTLRAWERRYGVPNPGRGEQGYRLYSEYDVRTLRWLKAQVESGLSIGRAVEYLGELRSGGSDPVSEPAYRPQEQSTSFLPSLPSATPPLQALANELQKALRNFDETSASEVMHHSFALYSVDHVLMEVVRPVLVALGDAWHRGELPIAVEHFATQFCMQHLLSMLAATAPPSHPGVIVAACAPGEMHQIGLLILVTMLRWRGWDVKYLGPDLPLERLEEVLSQIHPQVMMFSANRVETAERLADLSSLFERLPPPHPVVVLGGPAFRHARLSTDLPVLYLDASPSEMVQRIEEVMMHETKSWR